MKVNSKTEAINNLKTIRHSSKEDMPIDFHDELKILFTKWLPQRHAIVVYDNFNDFLNWIDIDKPQFIDEFTKPIIEKFARERLNRQKLEFDENLLATAKMHLPALQKRYRQLLWKNDYGVVKGTKDWIREIKEFIDDVVRPLDKKIEIINYEECARKIADWIELQPPSSELKFINTDHMTGYDFELHCTSLLQNAGWSVRTTSKTGDQGIDLVAEMNNFRVAIQCKRYKDSVGNKAVQEIFAGKNYETCNVAAVVSNAKYTVSAKKLAKSLNVLLLDVSELHRLEKILLDQRFL